MRRGPAVSRLVSLAFVSFSFALVSSSVARARHAPTASSPFRVKLNDAAFRNNETDIMKEFIAAHPEFELVEVVTSRNKVVTSGFDYLLTNRKSAPAAYSSGSTVSIVPGMQHLTHKALMGRTLGESPGIAPLSFRIPTELGKLVKYIEEHPEEHEKIWVMKENKHRGMGVTPVYLNQLLGRMLMGMKKNNGTNPIVLVQEFVENQLLLNDLPFTFRVWTVFGGGWNLARAYVFDGSIVPLGDKEFSSMNGDDRLKLAQDMIVNLFLQDREKANDPWAIDGEFKRYLNELTGSDEAFGLMWERLKRKTAHAFAAALPRLRGDIFRDSRGSYTYQDNGFEFLGFDFIVDKWYEPHLIEVNHLPSMARKVPGKRTPGSVFDEQKERFIAGLMTVLRKTKDKKSAHQMLARQAGCPVGSRAGEMMDMMYEGQIASQNGFSVITTEIYDEVHKHYPSGILYTLQRWLRRALPEFTVFAGAKELPRDQHVFDEVVRQTLHAVETRADERYESVVLQKLCNSRVELNSEL
jgi:hypothetical protein